MDQNKDKIEAKRQLQTFAKELEFGEFHRSLAERQREPNNSTTPLEEITRFGVSRRKAVAYFRALRGAEYGTLKMGRHGKPTRFVWSVSAKELGRQLLTALESPNADDEGDQSGRGGVNMHAHTFLLRPDVEVTLELPLDLSVEESKRLAEFIRSLPFRQQTRSGTLAAEE